MKVLFTAVLIDALHAALEDAEIAFKCVCMHVSTNILTFAVSGEVMLCKLRTYLAILLGFVGVDDCLFSNVLAQDRQQSGSLHVLDSEGFRLAAFSVNQRQHSILMSISARALSLPVLVADESLVNFDNATTGAELNGAIAARIR